MERGDAVAAVYDVADDGRAALRGDARGAGGRMAGWVRAADPDAPGGTAEWLVGNGSAFRYVPRAAGGPAPLVRAEAFVPRGIAADGAPYPVGVDGPFFAFASEGVVALFRVRDGR